MSVAVVGFASFGEDDCPKVKAQEDVGTVTIAVAGAEVKSTRFIKVSRRFRSMPCVSSGLLSCCNLVLHFLLCALVGFQDANAVDLRHLAFTGFNRIEMRIIKSNRIIFKEVDWI